jgi:hypothetical protein
MCVQEEERLKQQNGGSVNYVQNTNKKTTFGSKGYKAKNQHESGPSHVHSKSQGKAPAQQFQHQPDKKPAVAPNQCLWCKETGHWQKDCPKWMKHMLKKGEDIITFVDETLYLSYSKSTWWIDSGAIVHVANSMQGMHSSRILQRSRRSIKVANGVEAEVEAIVSYGPPWAHYLGGYQDRLLGGPLGLPGLRCTAPEGVKHKDYAGVVLG